MNKTFFILFFILTIILSLYSGYLIGKKETTDFYDSILRENISICLIPKNLIILNSRNYPTIKINMTKWDMMN